MFDYDKWQEIFISIQHNKLRTLLTMFGVFWGIFMLLLLLGAGRGLEKGVNFNFGGWATNSGFVWTRRTTIPFKGLKPGRFIRLTNEDTKAIRQGVSDLEYLSPRNQLGGFRGGNNVSRKNKAGAFNVYGDEPAFHHIQKMDFEAGRFINDLDISGNRKVAVIGADAKEILFKDEERIIGESIKINGVYFMVVGIVQSKRAGEEAEEDNQSIFVPLSTFQVAFNAGNRIGWYAFTAQQGVPVSIVEEQIKDVLRQRHSIHPDDTAALGSANLEEEHDKLMGLFTGIRTFIWIVGIGTLLAGIVGVSNIMLIIVKERTREIGIRKSLGATPWSIITMILQESVTLTAIAGYVGLISGIALLETISYFMQSSDFESGMFHPPDVNISIALASLAIIVICGTLAGLIPARKAAGISPVEAMRM